MAHCSCAQSPQLSGSSLLSSSTVHAGNTPRLASPLHQVQQPAHQEEADWQAAVAGQVASILDSLPPQDAAELLAAKAFLSRF